MLHDSAMRGRQGARGSAGQLAYRWNFLAVPTAVHVSRSSAVKIPSLTASSPCLRRDRASAATARKLSATCSTGSGVGKPSPSAGANASIEYTKSSIMTVAWVACSAMAEKASEPGKGIREKLKSLEVSYSGHNAEGSSPRVLVHAERPDFGRVRRQSFAVISTKHQGSRNTLCSLLDHLPEFGIPPDHPRCLLNLPLRDLLPAHGFFPGQTPFRFRIGVEPFLSAALTTLRGLLRWVRIWECDCFCGASRRRIRWGDRI